MSNHWRFECLSHIPSIMSDTFASHTGNADYKNHIALAKSRPLDMSMDDVNDREYHPNYYERNTHVFLIDHVNCELGIVDEYGVRKTLWETDPPEESDRIPAWYQITSRGITIMQCAMCVKDSPNDVKQASVLARGYSLCYQHATNKWL